jgi:hypothetical protein
MVAQGAVIEAFPDSKITAAALSDLEASDSILTAIPLISEARGPNELSDRVLIQTESAAIVAVYDNGAGWTVDHRVDGTDRDPDEVFEEAMIAGQGDTSLVDPPVDE